MKSAKKLSPLLTFLALFFLLGAAGCSGKEEKKIEEVVKRELELLKNLDSDATQKYISYQELFPDEEDTAISASMKEVFSLFFRDFDYKILNIHIDKDKENATVELRLVTIDAQALARDFTTAQLREEISMAAVSQDDHSSSVSLEKRYEILDQLLNSEDYQTVERNCTVSLISTEEEKERSWEIERTYTLENDLVGGLMTYLTDPDILPPQDTLLVYLDTLKNMTAAELGNYLNADSIASTEDKSKIALAQALVNQVYTSFDYEILSSEISGYQAEIKADITTFDCDSILKNYQKELDAYLASADAVIDGSQKRYETSYEMLLDAINNNKEVKTVETTFNLINDGASWKLEDAGTVFGQALFGTLTSSPVAE